MAKKAAPKGAKKKRKVSSARGSASRRKQTGADPRGVAGIVILCIGLLTLISQFIPSAGGLLSASTILARGLGGTLCLLLPVVICWAGVTLVFFSSGRLSAKTMICGALMFLFVETMLQLFQIGSIQAAIFADGHPANYGTFLLRSFKTSSMDCKGGGLIGALLAWPLYKALDIWGAVIVLIFASTIVLMVFTGVSFGGVGMLLSEMLDDLRVSIGERREEKEALRQSREDEELAREAELAEQRQQKRIERERREAERRAQQEAERAAQMQHEVHQDEQMPEQETAPQPARKRKGKPKLEVVRTEEQDEMHAAPVQRASAPRRDMDIRDERPLYIERDDEFARADYNDHYSDRQDAYSGMNRSAPRRRAPAFTMQEAEEAFLYGMNYQPEAQEPADETGSEPPYLPEQPAYAQAAWEHSGETALPDCGAEGEQPCGQELPQDFPQEMDEAEDEIPFWKANPDTIIETYAPQESDPSAENEAVIPQQEEAYGGYDAAGARNPESAEEEETADEGYTPYVSRRMARRQQTAPQPEAQDDGESTPLSRAILAAQRAAEGSRPQVQNVLAAQEAAVKDQTIVQLRGNRLDGTPLVVPKKDVHESPKNLQPEYIYPPIDLLNRSNATQDPNMNAKIQAGSAKLLSTLESFGVQAKLTHVTHGPAITRYELQPAPGVKVSRIVNLVDDIALNMASDGVRIEAPIPGKPAVGIEIPNDRIEMVSLRDVLESPEMTREKSPTAVALGKGISGAPVVADMAKMPHVLIAGATGSGKSVCINTIINSIIYRASPREVRLILIDPKVVELSVYNGIPHLLVPVVTDPKKASAALSWAVVEMEHRYKRFETMGVRNIKGYNDAIGPDEEPMSKIIVIIDELADLMMVAPGEVEESICRLAQLARAAGIHLVIATQRPSVNVITGVIKANIPSRIAFAVSSQIDSRTILDAGGAEKLLGKGDMLYAPQGAGKPTRVQGCFVSDDEVQRIVDFVRGKHTAEYNEDVMEQMNSAAEEEKAAAGEAPGGAEPVDEMLQKAIELAVEAGQVSISMLQRRLRVGYARAGRLVDEMTLRGIAGEAEGPTKPRTVLISREEWRRMQENQE